MTFTQDMQRLISWVDQPAPATAGETHTLLFTLTRNIEGIPVAFNGNLFFVPKGAAHGGNIRFARLRGGGFVLPFRNLGSAPFPTQVKVDSQGGWVRVIIDLSSTGLVGLIFHQWVAGSGEDTGVLATLESDVNVDFPSDNDSAILTISDGWDIVLQPSTAAP